MRVAFVCMGNICRSPMAEAVARSLLAEAGLHGEVSVESYGTTGYHAGDPMEPDAARVLSEHGWDPGHHVARQLGPSDLDRLDLVLCADRSNLEHVESMNARRGADKVDLRLLRSFDAEAPAGAEVPDPYFQGRAAFERSLATIEPACRGLVAWLSHPSGARQPPHGEVGSRPS